MRKCLMDKSRCSYLTHKILGTYKGMQSHCNICTEDAEYPPRTYRDANSGGDSLPREISAPARDFFKPARK